jgi:hypothetical protein
MPILTRMRRVAARLSLIRLHRSFTNQPRRQTSPLPLPLYLRRRQYHIKSWSEVA